MTRGGRLGWIWMVLLVGGSLSLSRMTPVVGAQGEGDYEIFIAGRYCETDPGGTYDPTCLPADGVVVTVIGPDGTGYGSCSLTAPDPEAAGSLAGCFVDVPFGATLTVTEDASTVRDGYAPTENPKTVTTPARSDAGERGIAALFDNVLQTGTAAAPDTAGEGDVAGAGDAENGQTAQVPAADQPQGQPVTVVEGTCDEPGTPVAALGSAVPPSGDRLGSSIAVIAASGLGTVPLTLDALLADAHAIVVRSEGADGTVLACGEIGAVADADGVASIGLRAVDESDVVGIAYLAQSASDESLTEVSFFVAEGLT